MTQRSPRAGKAAWFAAFGTVLAGLVLYVQPAHSGETAGPEAVLEHYLRAMYARDAEAAYALLSKTDRAEKTLDDYRAETGNFGGAALAMARTLAEAIRFDNVRVTRHGDRAEVTFDGRLPNANAAALETLVEGFDRARLGRLSDADVGLRVEAIRDLMRRGRLPVVDSRDERWELVNENGTWRVFLNWGEAVEVHFAAAVIGGLEWEFVPVRTRVLAKPGETIEMAYRARNFGARETAGKARHVIGPAGRAGLVEVISCFCFLEQSLRPGETVEMPLVFRIDFDAPEGLRRVDVLYQFYAVQNFPEGAEG